MTMLNSSIQLVDRFTHRSPKIVFFFCVIKHDKSTPIERKIGNAKSEMYQLLSGATAGRILPNKQKIKKIMHLKNDCIDIEENGDDDGRLFK